METGQIDDAAKHAAYVSDFYRRQPDECPDRDLENQAEDRRKMYGRNLDRIEIINEIYGGNEQSENDNYRELRITQIQERYREARKIEVQEDTHAVRYGRAFAFMRVFFRMVEKSRLLENEAKHGIPKSGSREGREKQRDELGEWR